MNRTTNIIPPRLERGDMIGIVSPCDVKFSDKLEPCLDELAKFGFRIKLGKNLYASSWGYAASAEERAEDFNGMINDPEVKMVFFGGGEVGNEVLPLLDYEAARRNPKIYCSYSDGTSILNAITANSGIVTYHGQTPRTFLPLSDYNAAQFEARLLGSDGVFVKSSDWLTVHGGKAEGILVGGYTQNFALLTGSPYMKLDLSKRYILFLEDHEWFSIPAAVARYLEHISQSEMFDSVDALIFGQYRNGDQSEIIEILRRFSLRHNIPVVKCDDFGHESNNAIFPIGMEASLYADNQELIFRS